MTFEKVLYDMLSSSAPIILCVLGGNFAHTANVLNIALEGMLLVGAFMAVLVAMLTGYYTTEADPETRPPAGRDESALETRRKTRLFWGPVGFIAGVLCTWLYNVLF